MTTTTTTTGPEPAFPTICALAVDSPVTCLDFQGELLAAGSEDGQIRIYTLGLADASAAPGLRNLIACAKEEVASLAWAPRPGAGGPEGGKRELWAAAGALICRYEVGGPSAVVVMQAAETVRPLRDEEDVISRIAIDGKGANLAYATEDGVVGVVSLAPERPKRAMRIGHSSVCDCVAFLPPNHGLVSAGYDYRIIQHEFSRGTLTNQLSLEQVTPTHAAVSLSPPFIQSMHVAPNGDLACGLANGEIYLASAARPEEKSKRKEKKEKKRRWAALAGHGVRQRAAEGPIVGVHHTGDGELVACTLLGRLVHFRVSESPRWELLRSETVQGVDKVNAMACSRAGRVALGGVTAGGKGVVVIKHLHPAEAPVEAEQ
ncbi:WD40 repeat-like protein [Calocera cornea HHB12733]|uniref:WD40 repeat-like protein n=1 Tax=Calocera cornea HHB12733 TaxID=1353952 RepID=A0A165H8Z3_9BASI|nr:WD40 repeat-like protein [Calocera cornea HHB12733]